MPKVPFLPEAWSEPEQPSTRALLAALGAEPERAWGGIMQRTKSHLAILVSFRMDARMRALADEEDLLQDVWLEAMDGIQRFEYRGPGSLRRWLAGILRNKLRELSRVGERRIWSGRRAASSSSSTSARQRTLEQLASAASRDKRQFELEERVRGVLASLPEPEREALLMRVYEGLTVREAAKIAGVDPASLSRRTTRALKRCALRLKGLD